MSSRILDSTVPMRTWWGVTRVTVRVDDTWANGNWRAAHVYAARFQLQKEFALRVTHVDHDGILHPAPHALSLMKHAQVAEQRARIGVWPATQSRTCMHRSAQNHSVNTAIRARLTHTHTRSAGLTGIAMKESNAPHSPQHSTTSLGDTCQIRLCSACVREQRPAA